jgi:hypothetical protein
MNVALLALVPVEIVRMLVGVVCSTTTCVRSICARLFGFG